MKPASPRTVLFIHSAGTGSGGASACCSISRPDCRRRSFGRWSGAMPRRCGAPARTPASSGPEGIPAGPHRVLVEGGQAVGGCGGRGNRSDGAGVVHVNGLEPLSWALAAARRVRVPVLIHLHSPTTADERIFSGLHQATAIVGVSRFVLDWTDSDGMPAGAARS